LEAAGARARGRPEARGSWTTHRSETGSGDGGGGYLCGGGRALRRLDSPANRAPAAWRRRSGTGAWPRWCRSPERGGSAAGRAAAAVSGVALVGNPWRALAISSMHLLVVDPANGGKAGGRWGGRRGGIRGARRSAAGGVDGDATSWRWRCRDGKAASWGRRIARERGTPPLASPRSRRQGSPPLLPRGGCPG